MFCVKKKKTVRVGWHCPAADWQRRAMATQTDQAACQAVNIDSAVVFVGVRHGWITELLSSMRTAMPLLSFCLFNFFSFSLCWSQTVWETRRGHSRGKMCNADWVSGSNSPPRILGCLGLRGLHWSGQLSSRAHVQHIVPAKAQESHREGGRNERETARGRRDRGRKS